MTYREKMDALNDCLEEPIQEVRRVLLDVIQANTTFFEDLTENERYQIGVLYGDCCSNVGLPTFVPFVSKQLQVA
jgi:hypothetical protein